MTTGSGRSYVIGPRGLQPWGADLGRDGPGNRPIPAPGSGLRRLRRQSSEWQHSTSTELRLCREPRSGFGRCGSRRGSSSTTRWKGFDPDDNRRSFGTAGRQGFGQGTSGRVSARTDVLRVRSTSTGRGLRPKSGGGGVARRTGRTSVLSPPVRSVATRVSSARGFGPLSRATRTCASVASQRGNRPHRFPEREASALRAGTARSIRAGTPVLVRAKRVGRCPHGHLQSGPQGPNPSGKGPIRKAEEPREGGGFGQSSLGVFLVVNSGTAGCQLKQSHDIHLLRAGDKTTERSSRNLE